MTYSLFLVACFLVGEPCRGFEVPGLTAEGCHDRLHELAAAREADGEPTFRSLVCARVMPS